MQDSPVSFSAGYTQDRGIITSLTLNPNPESEISMHYEKSENTQSSLNRGEKIIVMKNAGFEPRTAAPIVQLASNALSMWPQALLNE